MPRAKSDRPNNRSNPAKSAEIEAERCRFEAFLRSKGLRLTSPRAAIFEEVFRHHGHVEADGIVEHLKSMEKKASRATVYRTLDLLVEAGFVKPVLFGLPHSLYEHVHSGEHHDHMVCTVCGEIIEFYSEELEKTQSALCAQKEFDPERHTMVIFGKCADCRKNKNRNKKKTGR